MYNFVRNLCSKKIIFGRSFTEIFRSELWTFLRHALNDCSFACVVACFRKNQISSVFRATVYTTELDYVFSFFYIFVPDSRHTANFILNCKLKNLGIWSSNVFRLWHEFRCCQHISGKHHPFETQCIYTVFHKKRNRFIFDYKCRNFWSNFIVPVPVETGMKTPQ